MRPNPLENLSFNESNKKLLTLFPKFIHHVVALKTKNENNSSNANKTDFFVSNTIHKFWIIYGCIKCFWHKSINFTDCQNFIFRIFIIYILQPFDLQKGYWLTWMNVILFFNPYIRCLMCAKFNQMDLTSIFHIVGNSVSEVLRNFYYSILFNFFQFWRCLRTVIA